MAVEQAQVAFAPGSMVSPFQGIPWEAHAALQILKKYQDYTRALTKEREQVRVSVLRVSSGPYNPQNKGLHTN